LTVALLAIWSLLRSLRTGDSSIDRLAVRGRIVVELLRARPSLAFRPARLVELARALMAIANNEYDRRRDLDDQVGDAGFGGGPSIGPMQVYRRTALELGLYESPTAIVEGSPADREAYAALAADVAFCIRAGVRVYLAKLEGPAHGDAAEAIRRYNGGGDASRAYQSRALAFLSSSYGTGGDAEAA
jgi:hypothetical protein